MLSLIGRAFYRWPLLIVAFIAGVWLLLPAGHDDKKPSGLWNAPAESHNPETQGSLPSNDVEDVYRQAVAYLSGEGAPKDAHKALALFREAAQAGHAPAQESLGLLYETGVVAPQDMKEAARWYERAAKQGRPTAAYNLGLLYAWGRGVAKNEAEAAWWTEIAAERGLPEAQWTLGLMYARGAGVAKDRQKAMKWIEAAARNGMTAASKALEPQHAEALEIFFNLGEHPSLAYEAGQ